MDVQNPSPRTTLAILLGASQWPEFPDFPGSQAFANAAGGFRKYLFDPDLFGLPKENALDLFDVDDSPHVIDSKIRRFLEHKTLGMKQAGTAARDLLVYFVGHGDFVGRGSEYSLAVRCTSVESTRLSAIPIESLASTLTDKARYLRRIIILDCCYAAAAFTAFQAEGPARLGINQTFDAFKKEAKTVGKGTALLCSSGKTVESQIAADESCTMFSKALLQVLLTGNGHCGEQPYLSLREVADLTEEAIETMLEGQAPRPEVHSPDQKDRDVALVPFFPNLAARGAGVLHDAEVLRLDGRAPERSAQSPVVVKPASYPASRSIEGAGRPGRISRRQLLGLGGAGVVTLVGAGLTRVLSSRTPQVPSSFRATPTRTLHSTPTSTLAPSPISTSTPISPPHPPPIALGRLLYTYRGHLEIAHCLAWSPDSSRIASGSWDLTVQVWDAFDGGHAYIYHGHTNLVMAVEWSPDGKRIASGGYDTTAQVWNPANGGHVFIYRGHSQGVYALAWSPNSRRIASGSQDTTVQLWDAIDGSHLLIYRGHSNSVSAVAWSPNGRRIASGGLDNTMQLWDAATGNRNFTYRGRSSEVYAIAWSPDGKRIAFGSGPDSASIGDTTVQVWDTITSNHIFSYRGHSDAVTAVAWSPDGKRIASGSSDKTVQIWNATDGSHIFTYRGHSSTVSAVAWSPNGMYIASAGDSTTVQVWGAG